MGGAAAIEIVGQGLAGTCLAWRLWWRGMPFRVTDRGHGGSSRVAAGLVTPLSGKRYTTVWRFGEFRREAEDFHARVANTLGANFWHPVEVLRLAADDAELARLRARAADPVAARWISGETAPPDGWAGATLLDGGAWLDTRGFLDASRAFFAGHGLVCEGEALQKTGQGPVVRCDGAAGLLERFPGRHRCAKGEILTLQPEGGWSLGRIVMGGGGWLAPAPDGKVKAGATYEWQQLDETPTAAGRAEVVELARRLAPGGFTVTGHEAGVRPILRRSQPLAGRSGEHEWIFNGLGSKGSLYAPGVAARLASALLDDEPLDPELDISRWNGAVQ